MHIESNFDQET